MVAVLPLDVVAAKFREALVHFERLPTIERAAEFYATANAFVTSARSVLYVAQHQFGWRERPKGNGPLGSLEEKERKNFDAWFTVSPVVRAILSHPLSEDRHDIIHRSGQGGFVHVPKPRGGMAVDHGTPFKQSFWWGLIGLAGLPLEDDNLFFYLNGAGHKHDAVPYCSAYLDLVRHFFDELRSSPWA